MNIQFKNPHGGLSSALQERVERKLVKFSQFTDSDTSSSSAYFDVERAVGSHQTGNVWRATVNIDMGGTRYHAEELADTPEKASIRALKEVRRELKRAQGRRLTLVKRGGGFLKSLGRRLART